MEGGAAAVEVLVQNLIDVTKGEISLIRGLKKNAHKLQNRLTLIHSKLNDAEKKLITEEAVKTWLEQLQEVAFNADNVLDELKYDDIKRNMKIIRGEKKKVTSCFPSFSDYLHRRRMALVINEIYIQFESIKDDATELRLQSSPAIEYTLPEETDSFTLDPIFIGRDNDVSDIVGKILLKTEEPLSVLPIVGMGGLGKTTLARKVFNHETIKSHFGKQIWIHVPKDFDVVVLLKKILANLTSENVVDESREVLLEKIRKKLGDKTYLLVLDDVWDEDAQKWRSFKNSLLGITSTKGNFILVTTRIGEVASIVHTLDIHDLTILSNKDCWSIIKQKALSKEEGIPSSFQSIGNDIVKRCKGLPLAANVVGGLLHRTPKDKWVSIAEEWLSNLQVDDNDVSKILRLSFDHLSPPSLKRCFSYCSIFPKGEVIDKQELIELWMAQGFLQIDPKKGMEVEGNKFFYFLVQNSLLQAVNRNQYGNITHCSMHDLVHDLACIVSKGIYQVQHIGGENGGGESTSIPKERWRTLLFEAKVLSRTTFSDFRSLHTLTVMDHHVKELPSSINELIHLRYLNVSNTGIRDFPNSTGDLYHLQTLRAEFLEKLPDTVQYLINLRHLHLGSETKLPPNIERLTCLQTLEYYHLGEEKSRGIGQLGRLKNLQGKLHILNLENVHHQEEAKSANLFEKPKIFKLVLEWSSNREGETDDENVLEGLRPHSNLKRLHIIQFQGTRFPSWTMNIAEILNNLVEVSLKKCHKCEEIPMMGQLPHLKSLSLIDLRKVKSIRSSFKDSGCKETIVVFPVLQRLYISKMPNLIEWVEIELASAAENHPPELKVFPCLEYLQIEECRQLRIAPSQFPCHKELNICGSLITLEIDGVDESECVPDWFFNNQNLSSLDIRNCGKLRELPDGLHTLNSLKSLYISKCPNLKSIPPYRSDGESQGLTSLQTLFIEECEELMNLPCEMVESCAHSLQELSLRNLRSLTTLPMIIESCLPKMPLLKSLSIVEVPKLMITTPDFECFFPSNLESLSIKPVASDSSESVKTFVDIMLQATSHSLGWLTLYAMEDWDSLPHSLQHLKALSVLDLRNFRIEELPKWFGNLTSLQTLWFYNCKELKRVEAIRGLKKLTQLLIHDCHPILKSSIEQQHNDDVSHIPNILLDGQMMVGMYIEADTQQSKIMFEMRDEATRDRYCVNYLSLS